MSVCVCVCACVRVCVRVCACARVLRNHHCQEDLRKKRKDGMIQDYTLQNSKRPGLLLTEWQRTRVVLLLDSNRGSSSCHC